MVTQKVEINVTEGEGRSTNDSEVVTIPYSLAVTEPIYRCNNHFRCPPQRSGHLHAFMYRQHRITRDVPNQQTLKKKDNIFQKVTIVFLDFALPARFTSIDT